MAKQALAANRQRLWLFGQSCDFHLVTSTIALNADNFSAVRAAKSQIVLHGTAGNGSAESVIGWWNNPASSQAAAHFTVERTNTPQVARPAGGGADFTDSNLVDVVKMVDEEFNSFHGGLVNQTSIGIELVNVAWSWFASSTSDEPTLAGRHTPLSTCPAPINTGSTAAPVMRCNHARPANTNHFIHLDPPIGGADDYQSYEDRQYLAIILLLRYLCIGHRIPRKFLGQSRADVFRHYLDDGPADQKRSFRNQIMQFRGIFVHRNCHPNKMCPGILNRNRLYRGIIDEWWMPVQLDGLIRTYYSGPFYDPPFVAGSPVANSHFRYTAANRIEGVIYRNADLDAFIQTRSYYDLDQVNSYYAQTETALGGMFPVGVNKVWHGGIHLPAPAANLCVYAAASGTIVAARVASNMRTDFHPLFGSQRFILIRHTVYRTQQADPGGLGQRINYDADPVFVFSLYMHMGAVADRAAVNEENPPWFNEWRRANPAVDVGMDGEKGRVFAPNVQVSVGDILGPAGTFRGRRMIHFEVLTHRNNELTGAPWDDARKRVVDSNANVICDVPGLDAFLVDHTGDGIDVVDVLRAAAELRTSKTLHKSEWSLTAESQIEPLVPHPDRRATLWPHFSRFSWVAEAIAANARVQRDLGDADGMFWHYHPITFMQHVNKLIAGENREIRESEYHDTNVELDEDNFLTNFVDWRAAPAPGHFAPANVDADPLRPSYVSQGSDNFTFTRRDISCRQAGNHSPGTNPQQSTKFSLALLEILQRVRRHFNASITMSLSYLCANHNATPALCVMNTADFAAAHANGVAADIHPANATPASCRSLWNSVVAVVAAVTPEYQALCGTPTQANLPSGYNGVAFRTHPAAVEAKLRANPQVNLTNAEATAFRIHMGFNPDPPVAPPAQAGLLPVRLSVVFNRLDVLDDQDNMGSGEWTIQTSVNGASVGIFSGRDVDTGDTVTLGGAAWTHEVTIQPGGALQIRVSGHDEDTSSNDDLGNVSLRYDQNSSPPWAIGTWNATSSNGSFRINFTITSLNVEF